MIKRFGGNKLRITWFILLLVILGVSLLSCSSKDAGDEQFYSCGMHPNVVQKGPGLCPICNMNLTPISDSSGESVPEGERKILYWVAPMDPNYIMQEPGKSPMGMDLVPVYEDEVMGTGVTIDPVMLQNIGVKYAPVISGSLVREINAAAHIDYNEDNVTVVSARADGWIEKLHVSSSGVNVEAGDPLFDFYSPKLYSAQEEYVLALRAGDSSLAKSARDRLELLGASETEIESVKRNGAKRALTITAPTSGTVVAVGGMSSGMAGMSGMSGGGGMGGMSGMGGMGGMSGGGTGSTPSGSENSFREGDYISTGKPMYTIADLSSVWVYAHIYDDELPFVELGMDAMLELDYLPGETFDAQVEIIYPFLDSKTRDIKIRFTMENPDGKMMPEMFGKVHIHSTIAEDALIIPEEAVILSGNRSIVFLSLPGWKFAPVTVVTGPSDDEGNIQILSGLIEGQTVVKSGQFLLDSESRMKEALNKMMAGDTEIPPDHEHSAAEYPNLSPDDPEAKFRCPMPGDRYYAPEDGECPICGMFLEPHDPIESSESHNDDTHGAS